MYCLQYDSIEAFTTLKTKKKTKEKRKRICSLYYIGEKREVEEEKKSIYHLVDQPRTVQQMQVLKCVFIFKSTCEFNI